MKVIYIFLFVIFLGFSNLGLKSQNLRVPPNEERRFEIGSFQSRSIWRPASKEVGPRPVVILIPGSGAHGPEEMIPGAATIDGRDTSIFKSIAEPLRKAGVHTLAVGKPGVDYFTGWNLETWFYDQNLFNTLQWSDYLANVEAAVEFARTQPNVNPKAIYILGHSEGTQIAIDYAAQDSTLKGLILLGYTGKDLASTLNWQLFQRVIDHFIATDVDANHDEKVSRAEAQKWPAEFRWNWRPSQEFVTFDEIETVLRNDPGLQNVIRQARESSQYGGGMFNRGPIHEIAANLAIDIYAANGELDLQTPVTELRELEKACKKSHKKNCFISIIPGLGHGFSAPRPPRSHPLLDITVGPVQKAAEDWFFGLGKSLHK